MGCNRPHIHSLLTGLNYEKPKQQLSNNIKSSLLFAFFAIQTVFLQCIFLTFFIIFKIQISIHNYEEKYEKHKSKVKNTLTSNLFLPR